jgi:flavin-dependent dehydrogenase
MSKLQGALSERAVVRNRPRAVHELASHARCRGTNGLARNGILTQSLRGRFVQMNAPMYDVVVIGGGPAGSTVGAFLARAGKKVLLLEKEVFPRFHVGESLLPYNFRLFRELDLLPALEAAGFPKKFGAQFELGDGSKSVGFVFRQGKFTREPQAFQVERSRFDHILLKNAQARGVETREGWTVKTFSDDDEGVTIAASGPENNVQTFTARYLADASGRGNLTGNQEGLRVLHPHLKKLAVFGHFHNVQLDPGDKGGDTVITRLERKWFWFIPVSAQKTSVGCVLDKEEFNRWKKSPEEIFNALVQSSPPVRRRMENARPASPLHATADFSYYNRRLVGPRLIRVGDAAGFMDPIFSSGVYMAMLSGKLASQALLAAMRRDSSSRPFARYEKQFFSALKFYWEMIDGFYTTPFMEVFLEPREKWDLPAAVNAALAGELRGGWSLRWRMRLFFLLVKWQGRRPFLPRIAFQGSEPG